MKFKIFVFLVLGLCLAHGQNTELVTDRPDQTESAVVVPKNSLQVESGIFFQNEDPAESIEVAGTLLRYGLFKEIELRFATGYNLERAHSKNDFSKTIGLQLGAKFHLAEEKNLLPEMALITQITLPPIAEKNINSETSPGFLFAMEYSLSEKIGFGLNAGGDFISGEDFLFMYSSVIGIDLSQSVATYLEIYGDSPTKNDLNILFDGGFTWLIAPMTQLDFSLGKSIQAENDSWFINLGISSQFQNLF